MQFLIWLPGKSLRKIGFQLSNLNLWNAQNIPLLCAKCIANLVTSQFVQRAWCVNTDIIRLSLMMKMFTKGLREEWNNCRVLKNLEVGSKGWDRKALMPLNKQNVNQIKSTKIWLKLLKIHSRQINRRMKPLYKR